MIKTQQEYVLKLAQFNRIIKDDDLYDQYSDSTFIEDLAAELDEYKINQEMSVEDLDD